MDDTSYISRVLDGEEVTTGRWGGVRNGPRSRPQDVRDDAIGRPGQRRRHATDGSGAGARGRGMNRYQRGIVTLDGDPLLRNPEFQSFLTVVKSQCLMMFGDTREYACCLDILRPAQLARAAREVINSSEKSVFEHATQVAALSWVILSPGFTVSANVWTVDIAPQQGFEMIGHLAAWFVSIALLLKSLLDIDGGRCVRTVIFRIKLDVPPRFMDVMSQGFEHIAIALKQMAQVQEPLRVSCEWVQHSREPLGEQACSLRDRFTTNVLKGVTEYKRLTESHKVAFLMGLHPRLGRDSIVQTLSQDVVEKIFLSYEEQGLTVDFYNSSTTVGE